MKLQQGKATQQKQDSSCSISNKLRIPIPLRSAAHGTQKLIPNNLGQIYENQSHRKGAKRTSMPERRSATDLGWMNHGSDLGWLTSFFAESTSERIPFLGPLHLQLLQMKTEFCV